MQKSEKQLQVEQAIIEKMPQIQADLLKIVDNIFKADLPLSDAQKDTPYALTMDILTLGLAWLSNQYAPRHNKDKRAMNKLKPYIGTFQT